MPELHASPFRNYIQRNGFTIVSNLLLIYQQELGITDIELAFLLKIMRNRPGFAIHDKNLDPNVCQKTLSRRRNALKAKGLINYSVLKKQDPDSGWFQTVGISYDLSPLEEKLEAISDRIAEKDDSKLAEKIADEKMVVEEDEEASPIDAFMADYEKFYGVGYVPTEYEIKKYNELPDDTKKTIAYIFPYFRDKKLFSTLTPRLSLFFKTFRFADLRKYCIENGYVQDEAEADEPTEQTTDYAKLAIEVDKMTDELLEDYTFDNKNDASYFRRVSRGIVNRLYGYRSKDEIRKLIADRFDKLFGKGEKKEEEEWLTIEALV